MLSTIFAPAIFAIKELPAGRAKEWDRNVVHLDLNLYRESDSGFEYISRTSQRVIKMDSRLNNSNLGYQIALPRREALSIKPVSVLPEWVQRADEVEISILAVSVAVKSVKVIYDAKVFIGSLRTIGKVRSVAVEMGPNPAVVAIEVAVGVVEIGRLLWERHKATNWIQAHALEEEAYEVYVDMVMGIVGMFFPIGTIIWVVYEGVKVFMEYVGWADDIKNFYFNFFLGRVTAQQEAEAYESICTYLNETAVERSEMFKGEGRIGISVPWPPDISR